MWLNTLWQRWFGRTRPFPLTRQQRRHLRRRAATRLRLEALEDRTLLSSYTAGSASDLIADIKAANSAGGANTITLTANITLNAVDNNTNGANSLPVIAINDNLTIAGQGFTISRDTASGMPAFRLFDVAGGASLTLQNVTLQGGLAKGVGTAADGGAVFDSGSLVLQNVSVQDNSAVGSAAAARTANQPNGRAGQNAAGGGLYVTDGTVTLESGTNLSGNEVVGGAGGTGAADAVSGAFRGGVGGVGGIAQGGGLYANNSTVTLDGVTVASDRALGGTGGRGGAGSFVGGAGGAGGDALGGGLYVAGGTVSLNNSTLSNDSAQGGSGGKGGKGGGVSGTNGSGHSNPHIGNGGVGGAGGNASGGGLYVEGGTVSLSGDTLTGDTAQGGNGGNGGGGGVKSSVIRHGGAGGSGSGGGLYVAAGNVSLSGDTLSSNTARGGTGGTGGTSGNVSGNGGNAFGGGLYVQAGTVSLNSDTLSTNNADGGNGGVGGIGLFGGNGGNGGSAFGGGLYAVGGNVSLTNDTFANNNVRGGNGGKGNGDTFDSGAVFVDIGGNGGAGGNAFGGGLYVAAGSVNLLSDTVAGNNAFGGNGGNGGNGPAGEGSGGNGGNGAGGVGGGLFIGGGSVVLANTLIAEDSVTAGAAGAAGTGKFTQGKPGTAGSASDPDMSGTVASSDHDLIGNSSGFSAITSNGDILNPSSVGLGTLSNNGGLTQTLAVLGGSPAIDAGDSNAAAGPTDQRGYARLVGNAIDIGAYEYGATPAAVDLSVTGSATTAYPGEQLTFTLTVTNNGSSPQSNVALTDLLPANTTLVSWTPAAGWSGSDPAAGNGKVSAWIASLPGNASATFTLVVQVNSTTAPGTIIADTASVGPLADDPNPANNSVTVNAPVQPLADQLIAEINAANQAGGDNTIVLMPNATYLLNSALPVIAAGDNLTIVGNGALIERSEAFGTRAFRLLDVAKGASLTVQDLTLAHGLMFTGAGNTPAEGGAVYNSGNLMLSGVTVRSNMVLAATPSGHNEAARGNGFGGGLYVAAGTVTLTNDAFDANSAEGDLGGNGFGGGLYVAGGTVTLTNDTLNGNRVFGGSSDGNGGHGGIGAGGGLYVAGGTVALVHDTLGGNDANGGQSGFNIGGSGNTGGSGYGGGVAIAGGNLTLRNNTLSGNNAHGGGGGFGLPAQGGVPASNGGIGGNGFGGGLYAAGGNVTLDNNLFNANNALGGQGGPGGTAFGGGGSGGIGGGGGSGAGGGLYVAAGADTLTLTNNTLSGNNAQGGQGGQGGFGDSGAHAGGGGPGGSGTGGGLFVAGGTATLLNDTLSGNDARGGVGGTGGPAFSTTGAPGGNGGSGTGGGLFVAGGSVTLSNTLIAENIAAVGTAGAGGLSGVKATGTPGSAGSASDPDVSGTVASSDHDLIGDGTGGNLTDGVNGDQVGSSSSPINPLLGPLQDNGGPTPTLALLAGSPAIDAGDSNAATGPTDQRGYARLVGNAIDIGAYEYQNGAAAPAPADLSVTGSGAATGGKITYTLTVTNNSSTAQSNVALTDLLSMGTTLVSWTPAAGWSSSAPAAGSSGTVSAWIASLAGGTSATFTLVIQVNSGTVSDTVIRNTASVGPLADDPNPANNNIAFNTTVTVAQTTTSISAPTVTYGSNGVVTVTVASAGGTPTGNVTLIVDNGSPLTQALVDGSSTFTLSGLTAGDHSLSASYASQGSFEASSANGTLTVNKAVLTVTADNASRSYGVANPTFTVGYSGFVNGETLTTSGVTGSPSLTTTATNASAPGTYAITAAAGSLTASNYSFQFVNGTLTINPAPLSASGVPVSATAGAPFNGPVATFTNADPFGSAASYTAVIHWGDGSSSAGVVSGSGSTLTVSGSHTYPAPGNETIQVTIGHNLGYTTTATVSDSVTVRTLGMSPQRGQTAGIGFWQSRQGQALIDLFNGGPTATALSAWLAATFPNLYGVSAGANNLTGETNAQVAAFFLSQDALPAPKVEAEVLAAALNVYATTLSLGGTAAQAFGFRVSDAGLGADSVNVGPDGAAFGVANRTALNVYQLLLAVNQQAVNGVLYNGNAQLRRLAKNLFAALN
ncbi:MAG TPA: choice-of-anchor Q domain-containing protein [Gemmataceae bacterium]|jgi:uncharacterized repeat protein (TIGR01451 family)